MSTVRTQVAHKAFPRRGEAGFNLVEMMVVMLVIGILMAIAVPDFTGRNQRARVESAARQLSARMQISRQKAITTRIPHRMIIDRGSNEYYFQRQDNDSTWTLDPDAIYAIEGITTLETSIGGDSYEDEVYFETRGTIDSDDSPAVVTFISANEDTAVMSMVRTGRATVNLY